MDSTIALGPVGAFADPPLVDDAAALLAAAPLHAIGFAFTGSSYVRGAADDAALQQRLARRTRGIPVAITSVAATLGLRAVGTARIVMIDPPWFPPELTALGARCFRAHGFQVVRAGAAALPSDQRAIHPGQLFEWIRGQAPFQADALCLGGNGLRAVGVIAALEEELAIPVLTANQALLWHLLRLAGTRMPIVRYGRLFAHSRPPDAAMPVER